MKYTSLVTFVYYKDFQYGVDFFENVLQLEEVMDQGFAKVYRVNEKGYVGIVKSTNDPSNQTTLVSLSTLQVEEEYSRILKCNVENLTELKTIESIPLKSFFFDDKEGHKFEIQEFLLEEDRNQF